MVSKSKHQRQHCMPVPALTTPQLEDSYNLKSTSSGRSNLTASATMSYSQRNQIQTRSSTQSTQMTRYQGLSEYATSSQKVAASYYAGRTVEENCSGKKGMHLRGARCGCCTDQKADGDHDEDVPMADVGPVQPTTSSRAVSRYQPPPVFREHSQAPKHIDLSKTSRFSESYPKVSVTALRDNYAAKVASNGVGPSRSKTPAQPPSYEEQFPSLGSSGAGAGAGGGTLRPQKKVQAQEEHPLITFSEEEQALITFSDTDSKSPVKATESTSSTITTATTTTVVALSKPQLTADSPIERLPTPNRGTGFKTTERSNSLPEKSQKLQPPPRTQTPKPSSSSRYTRRAPQKKVVFFYDKGGDFYGFTNFSPHPVKYKGMTYPTSEHLFQALKFLDHRPLLAEHIRTYSDKPAVALQEARRFQPEVRPNWLALNIDMMKETIAYKFAQHDDLRKDLLGTGDAELVEKSDIDAFWGIGKDGRGRNELGKALMELRDTLRAQSMEPQADEAREQQ